MPAQKEQRVIEAAKLVFLRYGYKRVTMADIAEAAGMSRPALYLVFPSKEETLIAVTAQVFATMLEETREGLGRFPGVKDKLKFAFETWTVRGYELVRASPDAKDLVESSYEFATEATNKAAADFVAVLSDVLEPLVQRQARLDLSSVEIAQLLVSAMPGFKIAAKNTEQLRKSINAVIDLVLAGLDYVDETRIPKKSAKRSKQ